MDSGTRDFLLKAGVAAAVVGVGGYAAIRAVQGLTSASCNDPNSACYQATAPYRQQFQTCAAEYQSLMQQYLAEDNANGTALTSSQLANLSDLQACMNSAAANIGKAAAPFGVTPIDVIGDAIAVGVGAVGLAVTYRIITGAGAAATIRSAVMEAAAQARQLASTTASAVSQELSSLTSTSQSDAALEIEAYANADIIALSDVTDLTAEEAAGMAAEQAAVEGALESLLAKTADCAPCARVRAALAGTARVGY